MPTCSRIRGAARRSATTGAAEGWRARVLADVHPRPVCTDRPAAGRTSPTSWWSSPATASPRRRRARAHAHPLRRTPLRRAHRGDRAGARHRPAPDRVAVPARPAAHRRRHLGPGAGAALQHTGAPAAGARPRPRRRALVGALAPALTRRRPQLTHPAPRRTRRGGGRRHREPPDGDRGRLRRSGARARSGSPTGVARAAAALDTNDVRARVWQLPGAEFGAFRWGTPSTRCRGSPSAR